jgi:hypothetical protein
MLFERDDVGFLYHSCPSLLILALEIKSSRLDEALDR